MAQIPLKSIKFPGLPDTYTIDDGLSEEAKAALLACFEHVAWTDEHGQNYYDALEAALYSETDVSYITAVFTQGSMVIYPNTPLNDLKQHLTVTAYYNNGINLRITDYSLSGTLAVGSSTITVTYMGKTTTFVVNVSASPWIYEWYASSGTNPPDMIGTSFTIEQDAVKVLVPNLDVVIDQNSWEALIECKFTFVEQVNNPKLSISCYTSDTDNFNITVQPNPVADSGNRTKTYIYQNWKTSNKELLNYTASTFRVYRFVYENGTLNVYFDDTLVKSYTKADTLSHVTENKFVIRCATDSGASNADIIIKSLKIRTL